MSTNVLDDEVFKDWVDDHRDADGRISSDDFTEWLTKTADDHLNDSDEWLEWLEGRFDLDRQSRNEDPWDLVTYEKDFD